MLTAGCAPNGGVALAGGDLHELVAATSPAPAAAGAALVFEHVPDAARVAADRERRDAVVVGDGAWSWRVQVPPAGRLRGAVQLVPGTAGGGGVQTTVTVAAGGSEEVLEVIRLPGAAAAPEPGWAGFDLDLGPWSGREVVLGFRSVAWGDAGGEPRLAWAPLRVIPMPAPAAPEAPPSILLIVADTLRRDRVSAYDDALPTTPEIRRLLAGPGLVFERAYAQAAWTAPSVASYLTGRHPDQALAPGGGIAAGLPTLAELLRAHGYRTAAFVANPVLGGEGAFERGFESYFSAEVDDGWDGVRADELTARAAAWLRLHQGERFFLYVHYVDPHSPYDSPLEEEGTGETTAPPEVDDLRWGRAASADPAGDAARIAARYDGEVRYLDAAVGRLIEALPPDSPSGTLVVFTADHGEELLDHGWWGHGRTLYEELIRVPLLMRWDGRLPSGRVEGVVRLVDLVPTLAAAAGAPRPEGLAGVDLLPDLAAGRTPPRLTATAQHLHLGPERAAAVRDGLKLILFDREAAGVGDHPLLDFTIDLDRRLLARVEAYDLARDPRERHNLAASEPWPPELAALAEEIHGRLHRRLSGLRVVASGLPAGARVRARIVCTPAPGDLTPYFLAPGDSARLAGGELRLDLGSEALAKGVVVGSGCERVAAVEAALETAGGAPAAATLRVRAAGRPWPGVPITRAALAAQALWPPAAGGPALDLWYARAGVALAAPPRAGDESLERLRALGYLGG